MRRVDYAGDHAFFVQDGTLLAQPVGADHVSLAGDMVAISSTAAVLSGSPEIGFFWASPGGTLAYVTERVAGGNVQLAWLDRKGNRVGTVGKPGDYGQIALSPDGRNVALEIRNADTGWDVWVMDVARGVASRVTAGKGNERNPVWSRDGRARTFNAPTEEGANPKDDIRRKGLRASDPEQVLIDTPDLDYPEGWSHDGKTLLFIRRSAPGGGATQSVWAVSPGPNAEPEPILNAGFYVDEPQLSPDDRWLAYNSQESGRSEVYIEPFRREGERVRVSVDGGGQPKWRADGKQLFFTDLNGQLMSVSFRAVNGRPEVDLPTALFAIAGFEGPDFDDYAPSADGERFLVKLAVGEGQPAVMHVVTNWQSLVE